MDEEYNARGKNRLRDQETAKTLIETGCYCHLCGEFYLPPVVKPRLIQAHHIAGKTNDPLTIPVCLNCHAELNQRQRSYPSSRTNKANNKMMKLAFQLRGLSDLHFLESRMLREASDLILQQEFEEE